MARFDQILQHIAAEMEAVERALRDNVDSPVDSLQQVCGYVLQSGGKRLRPLILLLAGRACGQISAEHIRLACVLEYIHTATLLHDDVIDHAEIRRGNSSANKLWGNQPTILAGDYFFSKAFSLAVSCGDLAIMEQISATATCLAEAEMLQVAHVHDPEVSEQQYYDMIRNKTAVLIATAAGTGAMLARAAPEVVRGLHAYGMHLGMAFQITDDVLDYTAEQQELGKTIGKDLTEGSVTLPFIAALRNCSPADRERMIAFVRQPSAESTRLDAVIDLISRHGGTAYALEQARHFVARARDALAVLGQGPARDNLAALAAYVVDRRT